MQCQRQRDHFLCRGDENYMGCKAQVLLTQGQGWTMVCLLRGRGGLSSDSMNYAITEIVFWRSRNRAEMSAVSAFPPRRPNLLQQSICKHFGLRSAYWMEAWLRPSVQGLFPPSHSFYIHIQVSFLQATMLNVSANSLFFTFSSGLPYASNFWEDKKSGLHFLHICFFLVLQSFSLYLQETALVIFSWPVWACLNCAQSSKNTFSGGCLWIPARCHSQWDEKWWPHE